MIEFKKKCWRAELQDLGYSGSTTAPQFIGYFENQDDAIKVATEEQGDEQSTGKRGAVSAHVINIRIYESYKDWTVGKDLAVLEEIKSKLDPEHIEVLAKHLLNGTFKVKKKRKKSRV